MKNIFLKTSKTLNNQQCMSSKVIKNIGLIRSKLKFSNSKNNNVNCNPVKNSTFYFLHNPSFQSQRIYNPYNYYHFSSNNKTNTDILSNQNLDIKENTKDKIENSSMNKSSKNILIDDSHSFIKFKENENEKNMEPEKLNSISDDKNEKIDKTIKNDKNDLNRKYILSIINSKNSISPNVEYQISHKISNNKNTIKISKHKVIDDKKLSLTKTIIEKIKDIFLPKNYPNSVRDGYYNFAFYNFSYNIFYFYINFLSFQFSIEALGYSTKQSAVASAGINWAIKEGIGQIGSIYCISKLGKRAEKNIKEWRAISLIVLQLAFFIDLSILKFPNHFILLASLSALIKLSFATIASVTRTGILLAISKKNNVLDLSIKHQNQNNLAILIGNILGFLTTYMIKLNFDISFSIMTIGTIVSFYFISKTNKYLSINDFNYQRLYYFCRLYLVDNKIVPPTNVTNCERVFFRTPNIKFCSHKPDILMSLNKDLLVYFINLYEKCNFICIPKLRFNLLKMKEEFRIYTFLKINYTDIDILKAFMLTVKMEELLNLSGSSDHMKLDIKNCLEFVNSQINNEFLENMKLADWKIDFSSVIPDKIYNYHVISIDN